MQKLLFTGGTGFLGHNVKPMLDKRYEVTTIGITDKDMLRANLAKEVPTLPEFYDVVLHAAGKAHMYPKTEEERQAFYDVNYQGTVNLCKALEKVGMPKSFVFISTLDVYGVDGAKGYDENYPPPTCFSLREKQTDGRGVLDKVGRRTWCHHRYYQTVTDCRAKSARKPKGHD